MSYKIICIIHTVLEVTLHPLNKNFFLGDISFASSPSDELSDREVLKFIKNWLSKELPCIAGRREVLKNRYMVEIATQRTVPDIFQNYCDQLIRGKSIACLLIFNNPEYLQNSTSVSQVFYYLAEEMQKISKISAHALANGECLTKKISLTCPVTGILTEYDDFECIAFCPQSNNPDDPLYDPLMALPFPAVNISSDMYAFSNFVADMVYQRYKTSVFELSVDREKTELALNHCVMQWHRIATKTIQNYESITDTSLCPIHLNDKANQWVAGHKDPAFAEQFKEAHTHELPILYGKRIVKEWLNFFYKKGKFSASGLARDGELCC